MSRSDHPRNPGDQPPFESFGTAFGEWRVLLFFAGGEAISAGNDDQVHARFLSTVGQRLEALGFALELGEGEDARGPGMRPETNEAWTRGVPRYNSTGPRLVRLKLRHLGTPPASAADEARRCVATSASSLGLVIGADPDDVAAAAVVSAVQGLGLSCVRAETIAGGAEALIDKMTARLPVGVYQASPDAPVAKAAEPAMFASPWHTALLAPLVSMLVVHSVNPWLRSEVKTRFQLPGFSYEFLNFESVPLVAPLVVGVPTLVAYLVIWRLWRWTKVAPPHWAFRALLVPAFTTVYFAARFFIEGRIVSTHSQVVHSEGLGMLWETIGMFEPTAADHFRYLQPAGINYSRGIQPFWEPWSILMVALFVGGSALGSFYKRLRNTDP